MIATLTYFRVPGIPDQPLLFGARAFGCEQGPRRFPSEDPGQGTIRLGPSTTQIAYARLLRVRRSRTRVRSCVLG